MRIIALTLLLATTLIAQESKIAIRGLALGEVEFPELWVVDKKTPVPLTFSAFQPTLPIKADRVDPLLVFQGGLDEDGKPKDPKPLKVKLPAGSASILLLGWLVDEKPALLAIKDPFRASRNEDWIVINTTPKTIAIQVGAEAKPVRIKPGSHSDLRVTAPTDTGASTTIAYAEGNEWKSFYSAYVPIYSDKRCIVIVAAEGENYRVKVIPDKPVPPEKEE